jgi:hypothetical protein
VAFPPTISRQHCVYWHALLESEQLRDNLAEWPDRVTKGHRATRGQERFPGLEHRSIRATPEH